MLFHTLIIRDRFLDRMALWLTGSRKNKSQSYPSVAGLGYRAPEGAPVTDQHAGAETDSRNGDCGDRAGAGACDQLWNGQEGQAAKRQELAE